MTWRRTRFAAAGAWLLAAAAPAAAHGGTGLAGGFASGFAHPLSGLDHLLAMVAVGLWGAFLGRPMVYLLPVTFPLMMIAGAILGMLNVPMPSIQAGIALSVLILGGCIAASYRAPAGLAVAIVALFALFHGYAHGHELPSAADPAGYSLGFVTATGSLHGAGVVLGLFTASSAGRVMVRAGGALIMVAGAAFFYGAVAP